MASKRPAGNAGFFMFDIGALELLIILLVAFILFGPEKLPYVAVNLARIIKKIKVGGTSLQRALFTEIAIKEEGLASTKHFAKSGPKPSAHAENGVNSSDADLTGASDNDQNTQRPPQGL